MALLLVPQGVAYAALAGMPLVTGIYASLLPGLVAVLWGSSARLSVGPTALTCLLVAASLAPLAALGGPQWIELAVWLALLSGLLQVVLGWLRFGLLLNVVSSPVLTGFTQAAAVLIILTQIPALLGGGGNWSAFMARPQFHTLSASFGLASLAALLIIARAWPRFPAIILIVAAAAAISHAIGFERGGGAVIGALPAGLPSLYVPSWLPWATLGQLIVPALVIALVSYLETASSAKIENRRAGRRWDQDQDLIGQGLAKIASGFSGAFPTSTSFSRSAIGLVAGTTGWTMVFTVAAVLIVLLFFMPALYHVPRSVLAAIVIAAVASLISPAVFTRLWRMSRPEALTGAITFAVTLLAAPQLYWGVLVGLLLGLGHFLYHRLNPRIIEVGRHDDGRLRDRARWNLPPLAPDLYALRIDDQLDFASASAFERAIDEHLASHPEVRHVCLFAQPINRIDVTGLETFSQVRRKLEQRGIVLHVCGLKHPAEVRLRRAGELAEGPYLRLYATESDALAALVPRRPAEPVPE